MQRIFGEGRFRVRSDERVAAMVAPSDGFAEQLDGKGSARQLLRRKNEIDRCRTFDGNIFGWRETKRDERRRLNGIGILMHHRRNVFRLSF